MQRILRGHTARRRWHRSGRAVGGAQRMQTSWTTAKSIPEKPLLYAPQRLPPPMPYPPPPVRVTSGENRRVALERAKSEMFTMRLRDSSNVAALQYSPQHFDLVAKESLHDALYESGKRHFRAGHLERALVDFSLALRQLERIEKREARREGRAPCFDPESTDYRNLDDYLDRCSSGIQRRKRRATATVLDQRAVLVGAGGNPEQPSFCAKLQTACLRCLESMTELTEQLGRIRRDLTPSSAAQRSTPVGSGSADAAAV